MPQATTLEEAINNLRHEPLTDGRFVDFFVDTMDARGGKEAYPRLKRDLNSDKLGSKHYLFTGAKGCGKSTELMRLQESLTDFLVINFSVRNELDVYNFTHTELLIATMKKLFEGAKDNDIEVEEQSLALVLNWVENIDTHITQITGVGVEAKAGVSTKGGFLNIFKVFAELSSRAKYDNEVKEIIKKKGDNLISQLIDNSNLLINEIKNSLHKDNKGLLIIIEDLDKLDLKQGEELFLNYASRLIALNVNTIYTYPVSLKYHSKASLVWSAFDDAFLLPMIKTHYKNGDPYIDDGQAVLKEVLEKRMSPSLFESEELEMKFIKYSGGVIQDLFRFVKDAANYAMNRDRTVINEKDWAKTINLAIDDYRSMISDRVENNKVIVAASEYYKTLTNVAVSKNKQPENTMVELELRQNLCLLGYNSEGWIDVHPIVKEILIQKELIGNEYRIQ